MEGGEREIDLNFGLCTPPLPPPEPLLSASAPLSEDVAVVVVVVMGKLSTRVRRSGKEVEDMNNEMGVVSFSMRHRSFIEKSSTEEREL